MSILLRSRPGVHCIPPGCSHDASAPSVVRLFLHHDHCLGSGHTSKTNSFWINTFTLGNVSILTHSLTVQFAAMEGVTTSFIDMFPTEMRKAGRRECFLLFFCILCFFCQLVMITEVSIYLLCMNPFWECIAAKNLKTTVISSFFCIDMSIHNFDLWQKVAK